MSVGGDGVSSTDGMKRRRAHSDNADVKRFMVVVGQRPQRVIFGSMMAHDDDDDDGEVIMVAKGNMWTRAEGTSSSTPSFTLKLSNMLIVVRRLSAIRANKKSRTKPKGQVDDTFEVNYHS